MSNIRELKKEVKYVCGDLAAECLISRSLLKGVDAQVMDKIVGDIAALQQNALANSHFHFDKRPEDFPTRRDYNRARSEYFRKGYEAFRTHFMDHVEEIVKKMNAALPQAVKDANKANVEAEAKEEAEAKA